MAPIIELPLWFSDEFGVKAAKTLKTIIVVAEMPLSFRAAVFRHQLHIERPTDVEIAQIRARFLEILNDYMYDDYFDFNAADGYEVCKLMRDLR